MSGQPVNAAIGVGSNLGDRRAHIEAALAALSRVPGVKLVARGPVIENPPMVKEGVEPGGMYLNTAVVVRTTLDAHQLLARLQHIERDQGRQRDAKNVWGPRTLDLDLLLFGEEVIDDPGLRVPHPGLGERRFVLEPLAAIAPTWVAPGLGKSVAELLAGVGASRKHAQHAKVAAAKRKPSDPQGAEAEAEAAPRRGRGKARS